MGPRLTLRLPRNSSPQSRILTPTARGGSLVFLLGTPGPGGSGGPLWVP